MDVIAAYRDVGSYRGAAAICGTTHKTVKRIIEAHEAGAGSAGRRSGLPRPRNYDEVADLVAEKVKKTAGRISAKRLLPRRGRRAMRGRPRNFRRLVADAKRQWRQGQAPRRWSPAGGVDARVRRWSSTGASLGGAARVLRGAGLVAVPVRPVRRRREGRHHAGDAGRVLRGPRWGPEGGAGRPDGLPEGRGGRQRGGPDPGLRPVRHPLPVPARLLPGRRPGVQGDRGEPGRLCQGRPDGPARARRRPVGRSTWRGANAAAAAWCAEVNAAVHSEICAVPAERLATERGAARGVAVAAARDRPEADHAGRSTSCPASGSPRPATRSRTG